jgi:hypothetical protein
MDDGERDDLLERISRQGATVGASVPETITIGGEEIELAEFLIKTRKLERTPPETIADEIVGIDRALNALETIRHPHYGDLSRAQFVQDNKRWVDFLDQIA